MAAKGTSKRGMKSRARNALRNLRKKSETEVQKVKAFKREKDRLKRRSKAIARIEENKSKQIRIMQKKRRRERKLELERMEWYVSFLVKTSHLQFINKDISFTV